MHTIPTPKRVIEVGIMNIIFLFHFFFFFFFFKKFLDRRTIILLVGKAYQVAGQLDQKPLEVDGYLEVLH